MNILLVDDHLDSAAVIERLLVLRGHTVTIVGTVGDAQLHCETERFDVMISDIRLPDGDGWTLADTARRCGVVPIALSTLAQSSDIAQSEHSGFVAHLVKPVHFDELERVLADHDPAKQHQETTVRS